MPDCGRRRPRRWRRPSRAAARRGRPSDRRADRAHKVRAGVVPEEQDRLGQPRLSHDVTARIRDVRAVNEYPFWARHPRESAGIRNPQSLRDPHPQSPINPQSAIRNPQLDALARRADVVIVGAGLHWSGRRAASGTAARRQRARCSSARRSAGARARATAGRCSPGLKLDAATLRRAIRRGARAPAASMRPRESITRPRSAHRRGADRLRVRRTRPHPGRVRSRRTSARSCDEQALLARVFDHRVHVVPRAEQRSEIGTDAYHGVHGRRAQRRAEPGEVRAQGWPTPPARKGAAIVTRRRRHPRAPPRRPLDLSTTASRRDRGERRPVRHQRLHRRRRAGAAPAAGPDRQLHHRHRAAAAWTGGGDPAAQARRLRLEDISCTTSASPPIARLLFGGRAVFTPPTAQTTARAAAILRRDMIAIFPELAGAAIDYAWGGNVAFTRDQMPRAGMLDGAFYAGGYCGHGIAMATYLGRADRAAHRRRAGRAPVVRRCALRRFRSTAARPWFLPLVGAYYQVKDWLE